MKTSTIGPVLALSLAGAGVAGCLTTGSPSVKISAVHTPSAPASKIDLYYAGAVRAIEARDYAQALDYLQTARALAPNDVRVINAFGVVYDKLGRFDLSRRYYAEAKALEPASPVVGANMAYSARLQGFSDQPLAFASAAEAKAKLQPQGGPMAGSPVAVVKIDGGPLPIVTVPTAALAENAPELPRSSKRAHLVASVSPAMKLAAAQVAKIKVVQPVPAKSAATPAVEVKTAAAREAKLIPAEAPGTTLAASAPPKPAMSQVASVKVAPPVPANPAATLAAEVKTAAAREAKPIPAEAPRTKLAARAPAKPAVPPVASVKVAAHPAAKPAVAPAPKPLKVSAPKLAGAPILLVDASGSPDAAKRVSRQLTRLGWSVQISTAGHAPSAELSRIDYPSRTPQIARALARTLPGAVQVHACASRCTAIRLLVGRDARAWSQPRKMVSRL